MKMRIAQASLIEVTACAGGAILYLELPNDVSLSVHLSPTLAADFAADVLSELVPSSGLSLQEGQRP